MNIERMKKLSDFFRKLPKRHFDHEEWISSIDALDPISAPQIGEFNICGTSACIAGWEAFLVAPEIFAKKVDDISMLHIMDISHIARESLGLTYDEAAIMFAKCSNDARLYSGPYMKLETTTPTLAADFIDMCIVNGDVKMEYWKQVYEAQGVTQ